MKTHTRRLSRRLWRLLLLAGLLVGIGLLTGGLVTPAHAATITITTCDEPTLRIAIANAASGDTIAFGGSGTITLSSTLTISKNLTLDGSGHSVQVLKVNDGNFTLNALTIAHGLAPISSGGLFNNSGTVSISNSTFANNSASSQGGQAGPGGAGLLGLQVPWATLRHDRDVGRMVRQEIRS